jgi:hypothetical protein
MSSPAYYGTSSPISTSNINSRYEHSTQEATIWDQRSVTKNPSDELSVTLDKIRLLSKLTPVPVPVPLPVPALSR